MTAAATKNSTNGHAPANRLAGVPPPLDTVSHGEQAEAKPETNPQEGRTAQGTFAVGNKCARGNPTARRMAALRSALLNNLTPEKIAALGDRLYVAAMAGNFIAAKLLLAYSIGKAPEAVDADRLDLQEWMLLQENPTKPEIQRALLEDVEPAVAVGVVHELRKKTVDPDAPFAVVFDSKNREAFEAEIIAKRQRRK